MKTTYIANDGKEFSDVRECQKHEDNIHQVTNQYYDRQGNEIKGFENIMLSYNQEIAFIKVKDMEELYIIAKRLGLQIPPSIGQWKWDYDGIGGAWVKSDKIYDMHEERKKYLCEQREKIEKKLKKAREDLSVARSNVLSLQKEQSLINFKLNCNY